MLTPPRTLALVPATTAALLFVAACSSGEEPPTPPPPTVDVVTVTSGPVPNIVELPGRIEPVRTAEVRARVDGIVERRLYQEGSDVAAGAPLFLIDPRDKEAQLAQAQAALARAQAAQANARSIVARYEPLVNRKAVSAQEYDAALSDARQADAGVADARAALSRARLEVGYTMVRAPIAGRVGQAQVTEGALVSATSATLMTQINQLSPIYATFTQSSAKLQDLQQQVQSGRVSIPDLAAIEVRLILENGKEYGAVGHLDFADQSVDPSTGSQTLRARFPNPGRQLLPGQFVRGRVVAGTRRDGISVPERAVQIASEGASVMVVGKDDNVIQRTVELGGQSNGKWVILSGLKPSEKVIVDGWQKVQPGQKVTLRAAGARRSAATPITAR
ncbi:MAG: efflux RND transporter periplasmic adaptor subunit [Sphingobium sp.]